MVLGVWGRSQCTKDRERMAPSVKTAARKATGIGTCEGRGCRTFGRMMYRVTVMVRQPFADRRRYNGDIRAEWFKSVEKIRRHTMLGARSNGVRSDMRSCGFANRGLLDGFGVNLLLSLRNGRSRK